jgi:predicted secreted hydrolase
VKARAAIVSVALVLLATALGVVAWFQSREVAPAAQHGARLELETVLGGAGSEGFSRALEVRPFHFPADHGPHPGFRSEWWYFTGNLEGEGGRHFGYQWTLFRFALTPAAPARRSHWATRQLYMAHFTVTDVGAGRFHAHERLARGALDVAGARAEPFRVWIEDWSVAQGESADDAWRLQAASGEVAVDLQLRPAKPVVLQGDRGLSRKGATPGNASYYYSVPRLQTRGTVRVDGERFRVSGTSWLDREWSTSALEEGQSGWDWFGLQLSDGTELMFYQLRRRDGSVDTHSRGTFVDAQGQALSLVPPDVAVEVLESWDSPLGRRYPARWRLTVKPLALSLDIEPLLHNQELDTSFRYWEGAVRITGRRAGESLTGQGYVELTGY